MEVGYADIAGASICQLRFLGLLHSPYRSLKLQR
jgi:hypothetical protein